MLWKHQSMRRTVQRIDGDNTEPMMMSFNDARANGSSDLVNHLIQLNQEAGSITIQTVDGATALSQWMQ